MNSTFSNTAKENQLVSFRLGSEEYGLDIVKVQEIIKVPEITRVPKAPEYIEGVVNLRGSILPVIDARRRFGLERSERKDSTRIIVTDINNMTVGLVVDSVSEVLRIEDRDVEPTPFVFDETCDFLKGIGKLNGGKRLISLLDPEKIMGDTVREEILSGNSRSSQDSQSENSDLAAEKEDQYVSFKLGSEEYGIDIDMVEEIIRIPEIKSIPDVPFYIKGIISLRNKVLPVLSLRNRFGMDEKPFDDQSRIVIIRSKPSSENKAAGRESRFGIIVDVVNEVLSISGDMIDPASDIVMEGGNRNISGIGKLNEGKRLILLLDMDEVFNNSVGNLAESVSPEKSGKNAASPGGGKVMDEKQLVIFRIGNEEFGINIMDVREIIRMSDITEIPGSPYFVEGVVNLRGTVLPVIDVRKKFGLENRDKTGSNRIVVINQDDLTTGIVVDSVTEVLRISGSDIEPPPPVVSGIEADYIEGIGKMEKGERFIIILDLEKILDHKKSPKKHVEDESEPDEILLSESVENPETQSSGETLIENSDEKTAFSKSKKSSAGKSRKKSVNI